MAKFDLVGQIQINICAEIAPFLVFPRFWNTSYGKNKKA